MERKLELKVSGLCSRCENKKCPKIYTVGEVVGCKKFKAPEGEKKKK